MIMYGACVVHEELTCVHDVYRGMVHTYCGLCVSVYIMYIFVISLCMIHMNTVCGMYGEAHCYGAIMMHGYDCVSLMHVCYRGHLCSMCHVSVCDLYW